MRAVKAKTKPSAIPTALPKCPTGIHGLDEITLGGLPRGRPTLVCGSAGCGKTLLGMEFLVRGATEFNEPGVCLSFEETAEELASNVASLGFDLPTLVARKKLPIDHVYLERSLIEEAGDYDLEALFVRLGHAVDSIGAKRVLLDSIEALFAGLEKEALLRSELRRLFRWLKEKGLTAIVTGERGQGTLTRHGLEEYISDCVILLDHKVTETVLTRRLRIVKYRGSTHGTNEYPFLIESDGISVLPVTSIDLRHMASNERVSTGVPALDAMFGGKGYLPRQQRSGLRNRGHRQDQPGGSFRRCRLRSRGERACSSPLKSPPTRSSAICGPSESIWGAGSTRACCIFMPPGRPPSASKCTWSKSTRSSRSSSPSDRGGGPGHRLVAFRRGVGDQEHAAAPDGFPERASGSPP